MTHRRSLDVQLNAALLDFAPRFMKDQLEHLAHECDQRLERELLPRLRSILRQVDQERDAFEEHKRDAARDLRDHLNLLRLDAAAVDDAIGQLHVVAPRYLALFPRELSLTVPVSVSASLSTPSIAASLDCVFDTPDADTGSQVAASPASTPETSNHGAQDSTTQAKPWAYPAKPPTLDCPVQVQVIVESSLASSSPKRPKVDREAESDTPYKRQRTTDEKKTSEVAQPKITQRVAFPNLMTGVDGEEMASKYWIREHLGAEPHTFAPATSAQGTPQVDNTEDTGPRGEEIDDDFSPPFPKLRESTRSRQSDVEGDQGKPHARGETCHDGIMQR
ncbi:hypothetical protein E0Z10_g5999 [Xylaria hypoxylon]|uniref:Uncharacterized protein n=1 Tax=Xylaria hypoxylon TaxID=37992 RepID=A0A4Z0Z2F0_9PEZI|nr:hypothetical protein E0Z10_g5999 [Xylaria hypoxylon]